MEEAVEPVKTEATAPLAVERQDAKIQVPAPKDA